MCTQGAEPAMDWAYDVQHFLRILSISMQNAFNQPIDNWDESECECRAGSLNFSERTCAGVRST